MGLTDKLHSSMDPSFTDHEKGVVYSCDADGVFNIYYYDIEKGTSSKITNVIGGAFRPIVHSGNLYYYTYLEDGYAIVRNTFSKERPVAQIRFTQTSVNQKKIKHGIRCFYFGGR